MRNRLLSVCHSFIDNYKKTSVVVNCLNSLRARMMLKGHVNLKDRSIQSCMVERDYLSTLYVKKFGKMW